MEYPQITTADLKGYSGGEEMPLAAWSMQYIYQLTPTGCLFTTAIAYSFITLN